jgi:hypothetical protein
MLLGYASWFFLTQYDQSQLKNLLPFNEAKTIKNTVSNDAIQTNGELSIQNVIISEENETKSIQSDNEMNNSVNY